MTRVVLYDSQKDLRCASLYFKEITTFLVKELGIVTDEVVIHLVTQKKISQLHGQFFSDPTPTDCISFPIDGLSLSVGHHLLGEVFICPKVAIAQSKHYHTLPYEELIRYLIHGLLHLIGHDDTKRKERAVMKQQEEMLLKKVVAQFSPFLYN